MGVQIFIIAYFISKRREQTFSFPKAKTRLPNLGPVSLFRIAV